jgi:hypothetical protein
VHAAEDDVVSLRLFLSQYREAEGITAGIGPFHDLVSLVVMAKDEDSVTECGLGCSDSLREFTQCGVCVSLTER